MGEAADRAGAVGERQLRRDRVDADAEPGAAPGVRGQHVVHAVQQEHGPTVPGRLGEQAVDQGAVHAAAAGQELPAAAAVRVTPPAKHILGFRSPKQTKYLSASR